MQPEKNEKEVDIVSLSSEGKGVFFFTKGENEYKGIVRGGVPGDRLLVSLGKKRRKIFDACLEEVVTPSEKRVDPECMHVPVCGGCVIQQMAYEEQLAWKQKNLQTLFAPYIEQGAVFHPIIPCNDPFRYRNKMEFSFSQNLKGEQFLGLMKDGGRVLSLQQCPLSPIWFEKALDAVRIWWKGSSLEAYHHSKDKGSLRTLTLREGKKTGDKMIILTVSGNPSYALKKEQIEAFIKTALSIFPKEQQERVSIFIRVQQIQKGMTTQNYEWHIHGPDHIEEILEVSDTKKFKIKISPSSFFQPNTLQAEKLFSRALEMLSPYKVQTAMDLYCGTGTIALVLSLAASSVIGIEINPYAIFDADSNRVHNEIKGVEFFCGDTGKVLEKLREEKKFTQIDLVSIDPPRAGVDPKALLQICEIGPSWILYISCNPKTQAENVAQFAQAGYFLDQIQPVDQFPHTPHVETIALLKKKPVFV